MSSRSATFLLACVLASAVSLQADVAPFPSWRLTANGAISSVVQAGSAIYLGGAFTKIGRGVQPFDGVLDPASLTFAPEIGCARMSGRPLGSANVSGRFVWRAGGSLEDGAGPFPLLPDTALLKIGPDCRYDRRFRTVLPGNVMLGSVVETPASVFASLLYFTTFPITNANSANLVVEVDPRSGAYRRHWQQTVVLRGVSPNGRVIAADYSSVSAPELGWFDPAQGGFVPVRPVPSNQMSVTGAVVLVPRSDAGAYEYLAFDAATLAPLPSWPVVRANQDTPLVTEDAGRLFMAGTGVTVGGVPAPNVLAFDAATGAQVPGWTAPAWMSDAHTTLAALHAAVGRLLVFGDFAPGAPRDTTAALDAGTGALDPWELPFAVNGAPMQYDARLRFSGIAGTTRFARSGVAAVEAATGTPLSWARQLPVSPFIPPVTALAADLNAGHLYAGWPGAVRRYDLMSGATDPSWQLDLAAETDAPEAVSALALDQGRLFVTGSFFRARDGAAAWQDREGGAAITVGGALTAWRPRLKPRCGAGGRASIIEPCVRRMRITQGRVALQGEIQRLDAPGEAPRSLMTVTEDTGALDPLVPFVPLGSVTAIAAGPATLFVDGVAASERLLARVDATSGPRVIVSLGSLSILNQPFGNIEARDLRLYADVERDDSTGAPTGNPMSWSRPVAVADGIVDVGVNTGLATSIFPLSWHSALIAAPPAAPTGVVADLNGSRVTLRWSPGAGDLQKLVSPPPPGGTAAFSHVIAVSLVSGGPVVAQVDTNSPDTEYALTAPEGTFFVRVLARNAFGTSQPSAELRLDVRADAPEPPVAMLEAVTGNSVRVQWQAPPHGWAATGYLLEAGTSPGGTNLGVLPVAGLEFTATGVPPGRYFVRVRAVSAAGVGAPGAEVVLDVH